jgi:hypothetical protein
MRMEEHRQRRSLRDNPAGHEGQDANIRPIVLTGMGLALTLAVVGVIVYGVFRYLETHPATRIQSNPMAVFDSQVPPAPRIEEHPAIEIQQLHAQEEQTLSTYGWIDKNKGVVRIPIERAMELQLRRGFPARKEPLQK